MGTEDEKQRWPAELAETVASWLIGRLEKSAERIVVAGSLRRELDQVGDIEILYVPRWGEERSRKADLFGGPNFEKVDLVDRTLLDLIAGGALEKRRRKDGALAGYGELNKYVVSTGTGVPVDVFRTTTENWGMSLVVRTGPASWNKAMMSRFQSLGLGGHVDGVTRGGVELPCPGEEAVFRLLELPYVPPHQREDMLWLLATQ